MPCTRLLFPAYPSLRVYLPRRKHTHKPITAGEHTENSAIIIFSVRLFDFPNVAAIMVATVTQRLFSVVRLSTNCHRAAFTATPFIHSFSRLCVCAYVNEWNAYLHRAAALAVTATRSAKTCEYISAKMCYYDLFLFQCGRTGGRITCYIVYAMHEYLNIL